jgi:transcriptional regulator with XRE-family HTH domain
MDLALDVGISPRHLSYVETGRARPSVAVLLALAEHLALPLRTRNVWLLAAGYAPRYTEQPLASGQMAQIHAALDKLLSAHDPYPGVMLDGGWNVVRANSAAQRLIEGFAALTRNFHEWGAYLLRTLRRQVQESRDAQLAALEQEVLAYPHVAALSEAPGPAGGAPELLVPCEMDIGGQQLSLFTTMTAFGTPRDITLAELSIELFYPSDPATDALLHQFAAAA